MNSAVKKLLGECRVRIEGVMPENVLNRCALQGLELWDIECVDEITVGLRLPERELAELEKIAEECICSVTVSERVGGSRTGRMLSKHRWFAVFLTVFLLALFASSFFIWRIDIRGNETVSDGEILRQLENCGVGIGTFRYSIDTDLLRSKMTERLPELAWMTVNVNGSEATVLIAERQEEPEMYIPDRKNDMIAKRDGIVESVAALNGKPLVSPGQTVMRGDVLISSCMDSIGGTTVYVNADGKVMAKTAGRYMAVNPETQRMKTAHGRVKKRIALYFGKNRVNFYLGSGKTVDECDKTIHNYIIGIKGVFTLPLTVSVEELIAYNSEERRVNSGKEMLERLNKLIVSETDGEVVSSDAFTTVRDGLVYAVIRCECRENIAVNRQYPEVYGE